MRWLMLLLLLVTVAGCPTQDRGGAVDEPAVDPSVAERQNALLRDQAQFYAELERLQELASSRPTMDGLYAGQQHQRYALSSELVWPRASLVLKDEAGGGDWRLCLWNDAQPGEGGFEVLTDEVTGNGYKLEFRRGPLAITASAQWVHGRYLVCRREVVLEGVDHTATLPAGTADWLLEGPWMPYRMLPGGHGPFAVVPEAAADGAWHAESYPQSLAVPAIAVYDRIAGMLLSVADEHPRLLDRQYAVAYRVDPAKVNGAQARIACRDYDPTADAFADPPLAAGLVRRDSVVLAPLDIPLATNPAQQHELPAKFVIGELGKLTGAFHCTMLPEGRLEPGALLVLDEWLEDADALAGFGKLADSFGAHYVLTHGEDYVYQPGWDQLPAAAMPLLADRMVFAEGLPADVIARLDLLGGDAAKYRAGEAAVPDPRASGVAARMLAALGAKLNRFPDLHGVSLAVGINESGQLQQEQPAVSRPAATAYLALSLVETAGHAREDARVLFDGGLNLGLPPFADGYINSTGGGSSAAGETLYTLNGRFMNHVFTEVFKVKPFVDCGASLAEQVIATSAGVQGHFIHQALEQYAGFGPFALSQGELRRAGGDLLVLHTTPAACSYSASGDIPAEFSEMVAVVPADWDHAAAVWIAFLGVAGSVALDNYNNLTIGWGDPVQYWEGRLPPGLWSLDHPFPNEVEPGDAVLVIRKPLAPPGGGVDIS